MGDLLNNKTCLVTGATRGIGKAIAELFVSQGATVYAAARSQGSLASWADGINREHEGAAVPLYFDLANQSEIKDAVVRLRKETKTVDVLVNNAGIVSNELLGMISIDKTREMFEVNVFGLLSLSQLIATKFMRRQQSGSIVNIASVVGVEGSRGQIAYSASKGAVISLTKSMAKELAPENIRVNAIAPGMIDTERLSVTIKEDYKGKVPPIGMGRLGTPEEIADACLYFASDLSTYTTGQILVVGGVLTLP